MPKNLKFNIKNTQIAKALNLDTVKDKLEKKKASSSKTTPSKTAKKKSATKPTKEEVLVEEQELEKEAPRIRARSKSAFASPLIEEEEEEKEQSQPELKPEVEEVEKVEEEPPPPPEPEVIEKKPEEVVPEKKAPKMKLGPTGRHINDLLPKKKPKEAASQSKTEKEGAKKAPVKKEADRREEDASKKGKPSRFKEFRDIKPSSRRPQDQRGFDARARHGFRDIDEGQHWRKRRHSKQQKKAPEELAAARPSSITIRLPISIKDLAAEMKAKASELISKLFMQGIAVTLNDILEDETTVQLLGHELGCEITIDTSEEERVRITDQTIREEITATDPDKLQIRAPVVTFMGHVDHGKTSLIDYIRKSNVASGEAGAITQHIGAFRCSTDVGDIAVLDTPGHEAFSAMRARGADVTDIVVLVVAGDEGIRQQTTEALDQAKAAGKVIVVAINKSDKPNFNAENVYRQLSEQELLPEVWGGQTITVNCSAVTGEGIKELLEMLALQAEILELRGNPSGRARGTVLESEMHKGMGCVATVLVQNGTLRLGDSLVFGEHWGRVKTMHDQHGKNLEDATPSSPVEITGLSGLPEAGQEFIAVESDREAREIAEIRMQDVRQTRMQQVKRATLENVMEKAKEEVKKVLHVVLRADVQGSLEALETALKKIKSDKIDLNFVSMEVGEVTESDVQLASSANSLIIGFHTQVESHAADLIKELGVKVRLHDVIYHVVDDVKELMVEQLDKIPEETDKGKVEVRATFKSSHVGVIAGCIVTEGSIHRNHRVRLLRDGEVIWKGAISSLKRVKEDVKEVQKGLECGIVLSNYTDVQEGDILESYEITYKVQTL